MVVLPLSVHVENHVFLSRGVHVTGVTRRAVMKVVAKVGDLVQRTGDSQAQDEYWVAR
jgi:hypothetical protein